MAVADLIKSTMQLVLQEGADMETGLPIYKYKSFNNVKPGATPDQVYQVATVIADLQAYPLYNIVRKDTSDIRLG